MFLSSSPYNGSMWSKLRHWLTPHYTNNYRAKLLHNLTLFFIIIALGSFHFLSQYLARSPLHILGFQSSITPEQVIQQTNAQRLALGLPELKISAKLTQAAQAKANYMFQHDFWAHVAPDGTTPWHFITQTGYQYLYAGENLAKGFRNTPNMIQAWMNSPTHRANIVSPKYTDIGVAVVPGTLQGKETVLVVQMFATPQKPSTSPPEIQPTSSATISSQSQTQTPLIAQVQGANYHPQPLIDEYNLSRFVSFSLIFLLLLVLVLDLVIAESKNLSRRVGKNWAHIIFINLILIALTIAHAGNIL